MGTLVLQVKGIYAPVGSAKFYKDVMVDEGTLLLYDFSNIGTLENYSVAPGSPVYDLAADVSAPLGINNKTVVTASPTATPIITPGYGVDTQSFGTSANTTPRGIVFGNDLTDYITENQPRLLWTMWVKRKEVIPSSGIFMGASGEAPRGTFMHARISNTGDFSIMMADAQSGTNHGAGNLIQLSAEYRGPGLPLRRFYNGAFTAEGSSNADVFGVAEKPFYMGVTDRVTGVYNYRGFITDLSKSPLTADELVKKDWDYCHGIGQFAGRPTRRPFIDTV